MSQNRTSARARARRFVTRIAFSGFVLAAFVVLGEGVFRLVPNHYREMATRAQVENWHVPGKSYFYYGSMLGNPAQEDHRGNECTWNREGFHDVDHAVARTPTKGRIVVLGDSFVEGVHVKTDELLHRRLEAELATSAGIQAETLAFAWSGWGQVQQLEALRTRAARYRPDLVVVGFLGSNDVRNNQPELERLAGEQNGFLMSAANHLAFRRGLYFSSFVLDRVNRVKRGLSGGPIDYDVYRETPARPELWEDAWKRTRGLLSELSGECDRLGAKLAVVVLTSEKEVRGIGEPVGRILPGCDFRRPARLMLELCRERGIPCLDLAPRFVSRGGSDLDRLHLKNDGHWTRIGHRWAAEETARFLARETRLWGDVVAKLERELATPAVANDGLSPAQR